MKKIYAIIFALVLLPTVAFGYTVQKGDYPIKLWGDNWRTELNKYGITDPTKLPIGLEVDLDEPLLGGTPTPASSAPRVYIESSDWQLYNGAAAGDTTLTLDDLEDIYGTDITMGSSTKMYGRINPDGVSESISFTGITTNSDGTKTLTGVKTALAQYPYTETSGLALSHSIGSLFRLSNTAGFYNDFANKENAEIIENIWTYNQFPIVSSSTALPDANGELATKYYVDTVGAGGFTAANIATGEGLRVLGTSPETAGVYVRSDKGMVTSTTGIYQNIDSSTGLTQGASGIGLSTSTLVSLIATSTPTASLIPIADGSGKLDDGWLSDDINNKSKVQKSFVAGENITTGNAVSTYPIASNTSTALLTISPAGTSGADVYGSEWSAQTFTTANNTVNIVGGKVKLGRVNSPTGNVVISLYATSGGKPTGSILTSTSFAVSTIAASGVGNYSEMNFTFTSPYFVKASTQYAIVISAPSADGSNKVTWLLNASSIYAGGTIVASSNGGSTWGEPTTNDFSLVITEQIIDTVKIYKAQSTSATSYLFTNFFGFADANITSGASGLVNVGGISDNHTALTLGTTYYLSDTAGAIGTVAGSQSRKVGIAISETELLIKHDN